MQERINTGDNEFSDIVIQYEPNFGTVGIGLETSTAIPSLSKHLVDQLYGDVPTQTQIGALFEKRFEELGLVRTVEIDSTDAGAQWRNEVGRAILDSVTGSTVDNGLWTWMDRGSVNRMIRLLRKARDSAFGRDE